MIETVVLDYLIGQNINGVEDNVFAEVPVTPPARYIVIEKTASGAQDRIHSAMIAVQSYSKNSLLEAAQTNATVVEAMEAMAETVDGVYSCKLNSDYNFTNTETREYRYQAVFNLYY